MSTSHTAKIPIVVTEATKFGIIDELKAHTVVMEFYEKTGVLPATGDSFQNEANSLYFVVKERKIWDDCIELVIE